MRTFLLIALLSLSVYACHAQENFRQTAAVGNWTYGIFTSPKGKVFKMAYTNSNVNYWNDNQSRVAFLRVFQDKGGHVSIMLQAEHGDFYSGKGGSTTSFEFDTKTRRFRYDGEHVHNDFVWFEPPTPLYADILQSKTLLLTPPINEGVVFILIFQTEGLDMDNATL